MRTADLLTQQAMTPADPNISEHLVSLNTIVDGQANHFLDMMQDWIEGSLDIYKARL